MKTLQTFSMIISSGVQVEDSISFILSDPKNICSEISKIEFGDKKSVTIIQQQLGKNVNQFLEQVEDEYIRLNVDILGLLPNELAFRILFMMDHKSIIRSMRICKKWNELISNQVFWKCMSYRKGWGLVFLPKEKYFDWRAFYKQMDAASHINLTPIKVAYAKELIGCEGLQ